MKLFYGTSAMFATQIVNTGVDVTKGCGELGRGLYVTEQLATAMAYAKGRRGLPQGKVVWFDVSDNEYAKFNVLNVSMLQMLTTWYRLKVTGRTCKYRYGVDVVFGPLAHHPYRTQHKFESPRSQIVLNSSQRGSL